MTEKRFALGDYSNGVQELHFDEGFMLVEHKQADRLCELLNGLHEENQHLKRENLRLKKEIENFIKSIQESSRISAEGITKQWIREEYD